ncbi:hypothetical protein Bca4012_022412 [Brassica carinata]
MMVEADRHGGEQGNPPKCHGSGGPDSETRTQSSSSHGEKRSRVRSVSKRATEEEDVERRAGEASTKW